MDLSGRLVCGFFKPISLQLSWLILLLLRRSLPGLMNEAYFTLRTRFADLLVGDGKKSTVD